MNQTSLYILAVALALLQVFDYRTTRLIFESPRAVERWQLTRKLIARIGLRPTLLLLKGGAVALVWFMVLVPLVGTEALVRDVLLMALGALYATVAWHNWKSLQKE